MEHGQMDEAFQAQLLECFGRFPTSRDVIELQLHSGRGRLDHVLCAYLQRTRGIELGKLTNSTVRKKLLSSNLCKEYEDAKERLRKREKNPSTLVQDAHGPNAALSRSSSCPSDVLACSLLRPAYPLRILVVPFLTALGKVRDAHNTFLQKMSNCAFIPPRKSYSAWLKRICQVGGIELLVESQSSSKAGLSHAQLTTEERAFMLVAVGRYLFNSDHSNEALQCLESAESALSTSPEVLAATFHHGEVSTSSSVAATENLQARAATTDLNGESPKRRLAFLYCFIARTFTYRRLLKKDSEQLPFVLAEFEKAVQTFQAYCPLFGQDRYMRGMLLLNMANLILNASQEGDKSKAESVWNTLKRITGKSELEMQRCVLDPAEEQFDWREIATMYWNLHIEPYVWIAPLYRACTTIRTWPTGELQTAEQNLKRRLDWVETFSCTEDELVSIPGINAVPFCLEMEHICADLERSVAFTLKQAEFCEKLQRWISIMLPKVEAAATAFPKTENDQMVEFRALRERPQRYRYMYGSTNSNVEFSRIPMDALVLPASTSSYSSSSSAAPTRIESTFQYVHQQMEAMTDDEGVPSVDPNAIAEADSYLR